MVYATTGARENRPQRRKEQHLYSYRLIMPPLNPTAISLLKVVINLSHEAQVAAENEKRRQPLLFQRRNIVTITWRIKVLLTLFEEIKDADIVLPPSATVCFRDLHIVIQRIKLLVTHCAESSRLWLLMEHHILSEQFLELNHDMANALDILPLCLLDVCFEVREQIQLILKQARKATLYVDPEGAQLWSQLRSVMFAFESKETPNLHTLARIFGSLGLDSVINCREEVDKIMHELQEEHEEEANEIKNERVSCVNDLVSFVRYCKCVLYGATDVAIPANTVAEHQAEKEINHNVEEEIRVPDDFRCPISLEVMVDPVTVATGQTYERAAITRWMEEGHDTCPKSALKLQNNIMIPNYALRSVIRQWCERHHVRLPTVSNARNRAPSSSSPRAPQTSIAIEATKLTAEFLISQLNSMNTTSDAARSIIGELRMLAKIGSENRKLVAEAGAIPALISFLSSTDARAQEHAVTSILNLSIYPPNKALIVEAGAIDRLIELLHRDRVKEASQTSRENSAAALFSLSHVADYAAILGQHQDAIAGLLDLLEHGSSSGKRDALSALFNIGIHRLNRPALVQAGAVSALVEFLKKNQQQLAEAALAVLAIISKSEDGSAAITGMDRTVLPLLIRFLHTASPKGKESAASILFYLCRYNNDRVDLMSQLVSMSPPLMPCLRNLLSTGTPRATRKAACVIGILRKWEGSSASSSSHANISGGGGVVSSSAF